MTIPFLYASGSAPGGWLLSFWLFLDGSDVMKECLLGETLIYASLALITLCLGPDLGCLRQY